MNYFDLCEIFSTLPKFFDILRLSSSHRHYNNPLFRYDHPALDRHMFYKDGIGVYGPNNELVEFENLPDVLASGNLVIVDLNMF